VATLVTQERSKHEMSSTENSMGPRLVSDSQSEMTEIILPNDANTLGNLLGGRLMHFIDLTGAMAAYRHSRTHVVTAAMDHIDFIQPVHVGDLLILKSRVNRAFATSMEVGVKVWVEHPQTGSMLHVASAYLVFVAIDKSGQRVPIPELKPLTADEQRRYEGALRRREYRQAEAIRRKQARLAYATQKEAELANS
jgi:acyl-CoA hydrolase